MEFKLDLYFQHFHGQTLHPNLDSVVKMIMSDIKVSSVLIEPPKPKETSIDYCDRYYSGTQFI